MAEAEAEEGSGEVVTTHTVNLPVDTYNLLMARARVCEAYQAAQASKGAAAARKALLNAEIDLAKMEQKL